MLLLLLACRTAATGDSAAVDCSPAASLTHVRQDFGRVFVGEVARAVVSVVNLGDCPLDVLDAPVEAPNSIDGFTSRFDGPQPLQVGAEGAITIDFEPVGMGWFENAVVVQTDPPDDSLRIALVGIGTPVPDLVYDPEVLTFSDVVVGLEAQLTVTLTNPTDADTEVYMLKVDGADSLSLDLERNGSLPWTLHPGDEPVSFTVRFAPSDTTAVTGALAITSSDRNSPDVLLPINATAVMP